jgi:uncharacterized glyoxalase superfamily protein PhnB/general stress protein 26
MSYAGEEGDNGLRIENCRMWHTKEKAIIARASDLINSRTDYIGDGMEGWAVLSLIDDNGYPTSSTMTISKADGINWITFLSDTNGAKAKRIANSSKACVCISSSEYHISLVGTVEMITDTAVKKEHWQDVITKHYGSDWDDPDWAVFRFTTETYNLFFASDDTEAKGRIKESVEVHKQKIVPMMICAGQANQAIDLYVKAFGATILEKLTYADISSEDMGTEVKDEHKGFVGYCEVLIGDQVISLCDDSDAAENRKEISGNAYLMDLLVHFDTDEELKAAYDKLSEGGTVTSPLISQTYCSLTCALIDKFGGRWQLMSGYKG